MPDVAVSTSESDTRLPHDDTGDNGWDRSDTVSSATDPTDGSPEAVGRPLARGTRAWTHATSEGIIGDLPDSRRQEWPVQ